MQDLISKNITIEPNDWSVVEQEYNTACSLSCKPDATKFPKAKDGAVIDEEKSVRWNREEVARLQNAYTEEVKRLNRVRNSAINEAIDHAVHIIAKELDVTEDKARILWNFLYDKYHAYGEMFQHVDEYIDLISSICEK